MSNWLYELKQTVKMRKTRQKEFFAGVNFSKFPSVCSGSNFHKWMNLV